VCLHSQCPVHPAPALSSILCPFCSSSHPPVRSGEQELMRKPARVIYKARFQIRVCTWFPSAWGSSRAWSYYARSRGSSRSKSSQVKALGLASNTTWKYGWHLKFKKRKSVPCPDDLVFKNHRTVKDTDDVQSHNFTLTISFHPCLG
jgi:hypothetical protein